MVNVYFFLGLSLTVAIALPKTGVAQSLISLPPTDIPSPLPEATEPTVSTPPNPSPLPVEPPYSSEPTLQLSSPDETTNSSSSNFQFRLRHVEILGSTVLQPEIAALVEPLEGQEVTFDDLVNLRSAITQLYIDRGYITSGAFIPNNQDLSSGIVKIQVIEGQLEQIEITGLRRLQESYVRDRINLAASTPLNQQALVEALRLLQLNPLIQQINAELTSGSAPGRNILLVTVQEADAFHLGMSANNYRSPSIGSEQIRVEMAHNNVLGLGDRLSGAYGRTEGLDQLEVNYTVPLNARDGTFTVAYSLDRGQIVERDFADFNIRSDSETYSFNFRQPLVQTSLTEFSLGLGLDLRHNQTFILEDEPFSFSDGAENGESNLAVLRFSQEWVDRTASRVLAARSQFSLGLDAFNATVNDSGTDGQFFAWLGQFQYVQQMSPQLLLVTRFAAQFTPDSLLSLERFGFGWVDTVRGYRQNQLVTDNGILATVEARVALTPKFDRLQLVPFFDIGHGWNNRTPDPTSNLISSIGLGLRWLIAPNLLVQVDYGIPLTEVSNRGNSLQGRGLYLLLNYQPF